MTGLIDELLYKFGFKRKLNVRDELPSNLSGRVAIVTGGTRGLGLTVVRALISKGCFVFVASSQTRDKFSNIVDKIYHGLPEKDEETGVRRGTVSLHNLDLSSMDSVLTFVKSFEESKLNLNYIICNAGIMFAPKQLTVDEFESHLAINYLGHCMLIMKLLPKLKETADKTKVTSRIVSVSSSTHRITKFGFKDLLAQLNYRHYNEYAHSGLFNPYYSSSQAYAQSKLAQIMFSAKLSRRLKECSWGNVQCFSLHPGVILSDLYEHVHLIKYFPFLIPLIKLVTRDMVQGAETTLFAALSPELNDISGVYLEDCAIKEPSRQAQSLEDQDRLFTLTFQLLRRWPIFVLGQIGMSES